MLSTGAVQCWDILLRTRRVYRKHSTCTAPNAKAPTEASGAPTTLVAGLFQCGATGAFSGGLRQHSKPPCAVLWYEVQYPSNIFVNPILQQEMPNPFSQASSCCCVVDWSWQLKELAVGFSNFSWFRLCGLAGPHVPKRQPYPADMQQTQEEGDWKLFGFDLELCAAFEHDFAQACVLVHFLM